MLFGKLPYFPSYEAKRYSGLTTKITGIGEIPKVFGLNQPDQTTNYGSKRSQNTPQKN